MNPFSAFALRLTAVAALSTSLAAVAAVTPNPYIRISDSNIFRLQPPRPDKPEKPPPPNRLIPQIFITGLVELHGVPQALVEISEPGQPVKRPILAAGGASEHLEILQIDVVGERVRVLIDGEEKLLSIEKPKSSGSPSPVRAPGNFALPPMPEGKGMQPLIRG
jgi:hypothetical protein